MNKNVDILNKILVNIIHQYIKSHILYPSELYFSRIMWDWVNILKINIMIILMCLGKNHMIISTDTEKEFDKI